MKTANVTGILPLAYKIVKASGASMNSCSRVLMQGVEIDL